MKTNTIKIFNPNLFAELHEGRHVLTGVAVYRNAIICLHEDFDERIFGVIDLLPCSIVDKLVATTAREGSIAFMWKGKVPPKYSDGNVVQTKDGDTWVVILTVST